jgi:hypothetical protein
MRLDDDGELVHIDGAYVGHKVTAPRFLSLAGNTYTGAVKAFLATGSWPAPAPNKRNRNGKNGARTKSAPRGRRRAAI